MENFENEIWRPVEEFNGYEVSSLGDVKTIDRYIRGGWNCQQLRAGQPIKTYCGKNGYLETYLWKENKRYKRRIHTLVAKAFPEICGEWFDGAEVDHLNTIKTDNRAINLKWVTHKENANNPLTIEHKKKTKSPC